MAKPDKRPAKKPAPLRVDSMDAAWFVLDREFWLAMSLGEINDGSRSG